MKTIHSIAELINVAEKASKEKAGQFILIALEGPCGSGKSTLASFMAEQYDWQVIHMDDFYLPWSKRAENWESVPSGNIDTERLVGEVLKPLWENQTVTYRPYHCREDIYAQEQCLHPTGMVLLEGNYSMLPVLLPYSDLNLFLDTEESVCMERLKQREGERFEWFCHMWLPMERKYRMELSIRENCDFVIQSSILSQMQIV